MARDFQLSSGLKNYLFGTDDLVTALNTSGAASASGCAVLLFQGAIPASADAATTGTLLCTVKNGSDFVTWEADTVNKTVKKVAAETWSGIVGTATDQTLTHFRIVMDDGDAGTALSTTAKRIQGTIGNNTVDYDLFMNQPIVNTSDVKTIETFTISIAD